MTDVLAYYLFLISNYKTLQLNMYGVIISM
nr:MAG TPA: hypothetical protein [Bacteriophage sp.]